MERHRAYSVANSLPILLSRNRSIGNHFRDAGTTQQSRRAFKAQTNVHSTFALKHGVHKSMRHKKVKKS